MPHIDALTLMMYVDGELSDMEAAAVRDHVNACAGCRRALEMLQAEEKWVAERFFAADLPPPPDGAGSPDNRTGRRHSPLAQAKPPPFLVANPPGGRKHVDLARLLSPFLAENLGRVGSADLDRLAQPAFLEFRLLAE